MATEISKDYFRRRYLNDPEFRQRVLDRAHQWYREKLAREGRRTSFMRKADASITDEKTIEMKLIKFSAPWCASCKTLSARLRENPVGVEVEEVNVDEDVDRAFDFDVRTLPTCILADGCREVRRWTGYSPKLVDEIKACIHDEEGV